MICIGCKYYDDSVDCCNADENCYQVGYEKGKADGYSQAENDYFAQSKKDREDTYNSGYAIGRADAFEEVYNRLDEGVCELCDCKDFEHKCYKNCQEEARVLKKWLKEQKNEMC